MVSLHLDGIRLAPPEATDDVWDLTVDGRRIWSFRSADLVEDQADEQADDPTDAPDTSDGSPGGTVHVPWPHDLLRHLHGVSTFGVRGPSGERLAESELAFGDQPDGPVRVADAAGHPLVVDIGGRLVRTFESQGAGAVEPLMEAMAVVLDVLRRCGVDAFPAYGTLLGAVREGHVLGHDNDVDVAYVSRLRHPVDVIRESYAIQRALHAEGLSVSRYSGGAVKVEVDAGSGVHVGLDVFAGFFVGDSPDDRLCLMGEIYDPYERDWLLPLGEVELEGRRFPAPAAPERLLEATYGPGWRVPDPAFVYHTAASTRDRLDAWFRGTRTFRNRWDRRYSTSAGHGPWKRDPHKLARLLNRKEAPGTFVTDVGCGRGQDAVWLANRGHHVTGLDYSGNGFAHLAGRARAEGWDARFEVANLLETRHVAACAARLGLHEGPRAILARHVVDATTERGRRGLWRLAAALLGEHGGRLYCEFMVADPEGTGRPDVVYDDGLVHDVAVERVRSEVERAGGRVLVSRLLETRGHEQPSPAAAGSPDPVKCRMVVEWAP